MIEQNITYTDMDGNDKSESRYFKMIKPDSTPIIDTEDGRLYQRTIWMKDEDYRRMSRLADRLDISKSEVIMVALKLYEDGLNAVEESRRRPTSMSFEIFSDVEKADQGLVRLGEDVGEPIDPEKLDEIFSRPHYQW